MTPRSTLAERLRGLGLIKPAAPEMASPQAPPPRDSGSDALEAVLGGAWQRHETGSCFVIERRVDAEALYGTEPTGSRAARLAAAACEAPALTRQEPSRGPFVFFDLETTGLSGGAGTYAFLVGCGWFDEQGGFVTRQYLLARLADERAMLAAVAGELDRAGTLVSFNGKSFDAPLLETRYLYHRLQWPGSGKPHLDVLHPARRFWANPSGGSDCSLLALERQILGAYRTGDVSGFEIPTRYFQFLRTGDPRPLGAVAEHNRLDLLSLGGLTARLLDLIRCGPEAARDCREALALGRVYAGARLDDRARVAFSRAADGSAATRVLAVRELALAWRRARQYDEAALCWRRLLEMPGCPAQITREAMEALAIHHEHRVRDLAAARAFALRSLEHERRPAWDEAVRHRVARLDWKLEKERLSARPALPF